LTNGRRPRPTCPNEWYPADAADPEEARADCPREHDADDLVTASDTDAPRTPRHAARCGIAVQFRNDGPYTPWNYRPNGGPPSLIFPGHDRRRELGRHRHRSELGYIFVNSKDEPSSGWIAPNPRYNEQTKDTEFPYVQQSGGALSAEAKDANGNSLGTLPCFRPPWASLMAVNAATGEFAWRVPLGVNDSMPEGKKNVGSPGYGGPIVTKGASSSLARPATSSSAPSTRGPARSCGRSRFDYNVTAVPITYMGRTASNTSPSSPPRRARGTTRRCTSSPCHSGSLAPGDAGRSPSYFFGKPRSFFSLMASSRKNFIVPSLTS
jgi:hypothetical protein